MTAYGGGYKPESQEARALRSINQDSYDYRDQGKLLSKLTGDVSYMAQYMRNMQKGIDDANQNFVEQIGDFINEIMALIGGHGDTGFDFGDLKYVFQAIGALFGFDDATGIAKIFPINLIHAGWHFFSTYIIPVNDFPALVNLIFDQLIATMLDIFGEIPIVGNAVQTLASWLSNFRMAVRNGTEILGGIFADWNEALTTAIKKIVTRLKNIVRWFTGNATEDLDELENWGKRLPIKDLLGKILEDDIPDLDAKKISRGTILRARLGNQDFENLAAGSDFETTDIPWTLATQHTVDSTVNKFGTKSLKLTANSTNQTSTLQGDFPTEEDDQYLLATWVKRNSAWNAANTGNSRIVITGMPNDAPLGGLYLGPNDIGAAGLWHLKKSIITVPVGTGINSLKIEIKTDTTATAGNVWLDNIILRRIKGNDLIRDDLDAGKITKGKLLRRILGITDFENLAAGSDFEGVTNPWDLATAHTVDANVAKFGIQSLKCTGNAAAQSSTLQGDFDVTEGDRYYAELYAKKDSSWNGTSSNSRLVMYGLPGNVALDSIPLGSSNFLGTIWDQKVMRTLIPSGYTSIAFKIETGATTGNLWIDNIIIRRTKQGKDIDDNAIATNHIGDGVVTGGKVAGLDGSKITSGTFASERLADLSITAAKLADATITGAKIGPLAVAASHIVDNAINSNKIGPLAVLASHIVDNAVSNAKLGTDISGDKIVTGTVGSGRIGILDASKIGSGIFSGGLIPSLDSSKITTGNFAQSRVTNLTTDLGNAQSTATKAKGFVKSKVSAGSNILPNPGFENDAFVLSGTVNSSYSTDVARNGTRSLKLIGKNDYVGANLVVDDDSYYWIPASPGEWYYFEGYVYGKSTNTQNTGVAYLTIAWNLRSASGVESVTYSDAIYTNATTARNGVWTKISGYVQAPATTFQMLPLAYLNNAVGNNETYYFDDILLREVTTSSEINKALFNQAFAGSAIISGAVPSLDASKITSGSFGSSLITDGAISNVKLGTDISGNKIATGTVGAAYISALDASKISTGSFDQTRVLNLPTDLAAKLASIDFSTKIKASANLVVNGSFESSTFSFTPYGNPTQYGFSLEQKHSGTRSYKWTQSASSFCGIWFQIGHAGGDRQLETRPGDKFYVEAWVFAHTNNTATGNSYFGALCEDSTSSAYSYQTAASIPSWSSIPKGQWTKFSGYVTVPAGFDRISFYFQAINDVPAGNIFYIDDLVVREVTEPQAINTALYNSTSPSSTVLTSVVPSLDASKITSGTLGTGLVPNLDASKITTGTLGTGLVPNLDASKITTGTLGTGLVPNLDAGKITTGNFAQNRITNLSSDLTSISGTASTAKSVARTISNAGSNLLKNPGFEDTNFFLNRWWGDTALLNDNAAYARSGSRSFKLIGRGTTNQFSGVDISTDTNGLVVIPATAGDTFYMEFWVKASAAYTNLQYLTFRLVGVNASGGETGEYPAISIRQDQISSTSWTKVSGYVRLSAATTAGFYAQLYVDDLTPTTSSFYVDDLIIREVAHSASINNALYGSSVYTPASNVLSSVVPSLDASKVTTGNFAQSRITNLTTDITNVQNTGTKVTSVANTLAKRASNIIPNGTFENGDYFWQADPAWTRSTELPRSGSYSAKFVGTAPYGGVVVVTVDGSGYNLISAAKDDRYYVEFWVYAKSTNSNTTAGLVGLQFVPRDSAGYNTGEYPYVAIQGGPSYKGVWTKVFGYITLTLANTSSAYIQVFGDGGIPAGDVWFIDDVIVREISHSASVSAALYGSSVYVPQSNVLSSVVPSLDASKVTSGNFAQNRITNLSTDLTTNKNLAKSKLLNAANLVSNPSFELTNLYDAGLLDTTVKRSGSRSLKMTADGTYYKVMDVFYDEAGIMAIPVSGGDYFYVEGYVLRGGSTPGSGQVYFQSNYFDAAGNEYYVASVGMTPVANLSTSTWTKISGYLSVPADATKYRIYLVMDNTLASGTIVYFDDVVVKEYTSTANLNNNIFGQKTLANTFLTSVIPGIDATKVTSGNFAQNRITNLTTDLSKSSGIATSLSRKSSNICTDPGFENTSMAFYGNGPVRTSEMSMANGTYSAKFTANGTWQSISLTVDGNGQLYPAGSVNDSYYCEFYIRGNINNGSTNTGALYCQIVGYDVNGNQTEAPVSIWAASLSTYKNTWYKVSGYLTLSNSNTINILPIIGMSNDVPSGYIFYVDNVIIREISHSAQINSALTGSTSPVSTVLSGAVPSLDASKVTSGNFAQNRITNLPSDLSGRVTTTSYYSNINGGNNLAPNPGFEDSSVILGWQQGFNLSYNTSASNSHSGNNSLKFIGVSGQIYHTILGSKDGELTMQSGPGRSYYLEAWVKGDSSNPSTPVSGGVIVMGIWAYNSAGYATGYLDAVTIILGGSTVGKDAWVKLSGTVTLPNNANIVLARPLMYLDAAVPSSYTFYVDDIIVRDVTEINSVNAQIANALTNTTDSITSGGFTQALSGLTKTYSTLADATRAVQTLQTSKVSNTSKGALVTVNFDDYQDGALSTRCAFFAVSYTGAGNGTIDIAAGTAGWTTNNNGDRDCKIIYGGSGSTGGSATYTDYQYIKGTMTQPPQQNGGYFYALGRVNAAGTEYVFARAYCDGFLSYKADFGYKLAAGSEVVLKSGINLTWSLDMALEVGTTAGIRTYKIWSGNKVVWDSTGTNGVSDTASNYGANNRYWGSIAQTRSGKTSGRLGGVSVADNQTPTYSGSTARMYRASGTSVTLYGSGYGDAVLPSFFDNTSWNSLDITVEPSNNVFTVTTAGTYAISARLYVNSQVLAWCQVNLQRYTGGAWQSTPIQRGNTITPQNISTTLDAALTGSWVQYLAAGDKVRLMTKKSTAGDVSVLSGESTGSQSYFSISLLSS